MTVVDRNLFNEIANDILLSVKPVYLRKEIVCRMLDLVDKLIVETRKETAEKFERLASEAFLKVNRIDLDEWNWYQYKLGEICKEITESKV